MMEIRHVFSGHSHNAAPLWEQQEQQANELIGKRLNDWQQNCSLQVNSTADEPQVPGMFSFENFKGKVIPVYDSSTTDDLIQKLGWKVAYVFQIIKVYTSQRVLSVEFIKALKHSKQFIG